MQVLYSDELRKRSITAMTFWDRLVHRLPNFPLYLYGIRAKLGYGVITRQSTDYVGPADRSTDLNTFNQSSDFIEHVQY